MEKYRDQFSKLLIKCGQDNFLKRFVLTYEGDESKSFVHSFNQFKAAWNTLTQETKDQYLKKFILNEEGYYVVMNKNISLENFNELIYLGKIGQTGKTIWKWVFLTEYIKDSSMIKFRLINLYDSDEDVITISSENKIKNTKTNYCANYELNISLKNLPSIIDDNLYEVNGDPAFKCDKLDRELTIE